MEERAVRTRLGLPAAGVWSVLLALIAAPVTAQADESVWTELSLSTARSASAGRSVPLPAAYRAFVVDLTTLKANLTPQAQARSSVMTVSLPHPSGGFRAFEVYPSDVMSAALASQFPELHAFKGRAVDDSRTTVQIEITPRGVTAQVLAPGERWVIDPLTKGRADRAVVYYAEDTHSAGRDHKCLVHAPEDSRAGERPVVLTRRSESRVGARSIGQSLRTYRLAVATTGEYSQYHGGTKPLALSAVLTTIARVTGIYEKELAVSFTLIDITDIIFLDATNDGLSNDNANQLIDESQIVINNAIGAANYDVGHTFSTGGGGLAQLETPCKDASKAKGITGRTNPIGDPFDVDYVAHEIGHQFGGDHTYNGTVCTTGNSATAYEPGGGSTIQAYAGICGSDDLQANSDPIFSAVSFDQMVSYIEDDVGGDCAAPSDVTSPVSGAVNSPPAVDAGDDFTVPNNTPLVLTGSATDADGDPLTYLWEQRDLGPKVPLGAADNGASPLFRVWTPEESSSRYLPKLANVVAGVQSVAEIMPSVPRNMDFRLTARDGNGGVNSDDMVVTVVGTNPLYPSFSLIEPSLGGEELGSTATVRWHVGETYAPPVSTEMVDFYLSTDGGATFAETPFDSTPNLGYARVTFPSGIQTNTARLMIRGQSNIFYNLSSEDFTLDSDAAATPEIPAPVLWSVIPIDEGATFYFGEGPNPDGSAGAANLYEATCRGSLTESFNESASPVTIISGSQPRAISTVTVDAVGGVSQAGLRLDLDISHAYRGDIQVTLTSPSGYQVVVISSDYSDSDADIVLTNFPVLGFNGQQIQGEWTLEVTDVWPTADDGVFNSWSLSGSGQTDQVLSSSLDHSPITVAGLSNGSQYACELTAYDTFATPRRGSRSVLLGAVTPSDSATVFTVTPSAAEGGAIQPDIALPVLSGNQVAFSLTPDQGYLVDAVMGSCGGNFSRSTYTTQPILDDCTVEASFVLRRAGVPVIDSVDYGDGEITIRVSPGPGGSPDTYSVTCSDGVNSFEGSSASTTITVSGLTNGTPYTCSVIASNAFATSPATNPTAAITPEATGGGLPIWLLYQATQ